MALHYYYVPLSGSGFITHEDQEIAPIQGYGADIWVTENIAWAERVGAIEKTKEEAQAIIDANYTPMHIVVFPSRSVNLPTSSIDPLNLP